MKNLLFALAFVVCCTAARAQSTTYKNLALEGGGVKGFAYVGAFEVLDSLGILNGIERVGGTSVGAIQAMLLALGYTSAEMTRIAENMPLRQLNDGSLISGISRLKNNLGFYRGKAAYQWIEKLVGDKTGNVNTTFKQLHDLRDSCGFKDLYVTGADLTYQCLRIFSHETYPDMRIKDAVRISMSIPLYYEPIVIDEQGQIVDSSYKGVTHFMVDGAVLMNYPLTIFDSGRYCNKPDGYVYNTQTLGLILEKPEQIEYSMDHKGNYPMPISSLNEYLKALYRTMVDKPNPDVNLPKEQQRTIAISNLNIPGRVRKLPAETIEALVQSGREAVRNYFVNVKAATVAGN